MRERCHALEAPTHAPAMPQMTWEGRKETLGWETYRCAQRGSFQSAWSEEVQHLACLCMGRSLGDESSLCQAGVEAMIWCPSPGRAETRFVRCTRHRGSACLGGLRGDEGPPSRVLSSPCVATGRVGGLYEPCYGTACQGELYKVLRSQNGTCTRVFNYPNVKKGDQIF